MASYNLGKAELNDKSKQSVNVAFFPYFYSISFYYRHFCKFYEAFVKKINIGYLQYYKWKHHLQIPRGEGSPEIKSGEHKG